MRIKEMPPMRRAALAVLALGVALVTAPGQADAHIRKERTRISGETAVATWNYQIGDVATYISVVVTDNDTRSGGHPSSDRFATVSILRSNVVTGNVLVAGVADLSDFDFEVDHRRARLRAEGLFEDDSTLTFFPISIDLTWTATGEPERQHSREIFREPGFIIKTRFRGVFRDAVAAGSIFGDDTQFVAGDAESAQIQKTTSGAVTIQISKCGER
jgi:hypothetical protein